MKSILIFILIVCNSAQAQTNTKRDSLISVKRAELSQNVLKVVKDKYRLRFDSSYVLIYIDFSTPKIRFNSGYSGEYIEISNIKTDNSAFNQFVGLVKKKDSNIQIQRLEAEGVHRSNNINLDTFLGSNTAKPKIYIEIYPPIGGWQNFDLLFYKYDLGETKSHRLNFPGFVYYKVNERLISKDVVVSVELDEKNLSHVLSQSIVEF